MNKNMIFVLAGGFVVAVLVSVIMISLMRPAPQHNAAAAVETVDLLVIVKAVKQGEKITKSHLNWKSWPKEAAFDGVVINTSDANGGPDPLANVLNYRAARPMNVGEPVLTSSLLKDGPGLMAASLNPGMRAVALSVNAAATAGGFITPGDKVDVIITFALRIDQADQPITQQIVERYISETVLENVRVMAIDQRVERPENGAKIGRTVTLEVSQKGARQLMLAGQMGELSLSLRPLDPDQDDNLAKIQGENNARNQGEEPVTDVTTAKIYGEIERLKQNSSISPSGSVRILSGSGVQYMPAGASPSPVKSSASSLSAQEISQNYTTTGQGLGHINQPDLPEQNIILGDDAVLQRAQYDYSEE